MSYPVDPAVSSRLIGVIMKSNIPLENRKELYRILERADELELTFKNIAQIVKYRLPKESNGK